MIAQELEVCLHTAFVEARQERHEEIGVEHLLLAILGSPTAAEALRTSGASPDQLRKEIGDHLAVHVRYAPPGKDVDTQPTIGFQRVIQRAILQAQSSGKKEVTGADVLAAIYGEKDSHAVRLLKQHGLARPGQVVRSNEPRSSEQLLLALLDHPAATRVLRGCGVKVHKLRRDLLQHLSGQPSIPVDPEMAGADALVTILSDKNSLASQLLARHGITRFDAVFYLTHGVAPATASYEADLPEGADLQVVLYNDDYTPMEFVVGILEKFFLMTRVDANETMLEVHRTGVGLCGLFARDDAVELVKAVMEHARQHGHPLNCTVLAPQPI